MNLSELLIFVTSNIFCSEGAFGRIESTWVTIPGLKVVSGLLKKFSLHLELANAVAQYPRCKTIRAHRLKDSSVSIVLKAQLLAKSSLLILRVESTVLS